jgi:hypothetical protein
MRLAWPCCGQIWLEYLKNFSAEALGVLADFMNNCDCAPGPCKVTQTLRADGKIDLAIALENP